MLQKSVAMGAVGLAVIAALMGSMQESFIFLNLKAVTKTPQEARGWEYEDLRLPVDGETTEGWFIPVDNARGTVLFSHGTGSTISSCFGVASEFRDLGLNVLVYDYGGYGNSTGDPTEARCYADIRAMWHYLTDTRGISPDKIVLACSSLGGGPTCDLGAEVTPAAILLESTYLSIPDIARDTFPFLPASGFIQHRFESYLKVPKFTCPVLVSHSPDDHLIPFRHGQELFRLAPEPKQFLETTGEHGDGHGCCREEWAKMVDDMLTPRLGPKQ